MKKVGYVFFYIIYYSNFDDHSIFKDDGYNSAPWTRENTLDFTEVKTNSLSPDNLSEPADIEELKEQTLDDHISTVDRKVDPNNGHVCQLVLGVVGSTASAPIFTKFGNPESVKNLTSGPPNIGMTHQEEIDLQESNLSETNLVETSLLESSLVETSLVESNLKETNLVDTSLVETNLVGARLVESYLGDQNLEEENLEDSILAQFNEDRINSAATKLQAGFKGMKVRKEIEVIPKLLQDDHNLVEEVPRVGAIPFELHESVLNLNEEPNYPIISSPLKENSSIKNGQDFEDEVLHSQTEISFPDDMRVEVFYIPDHVDSLKLLYYLKEKNIMFVSTKLSEKDLQENWFLSLNPSGTAPVLKFRDKETISGVLRIFNFLEENVPVDKYQMLIPCTTSTKLYQKYIYFSSQIENINFDALKLNNSKSISSDVEKLKSDLRLLKGNIK